MLPEISWVRKEIIMIQGRVSISERVHFLSRRKRRKGEKKKVGNGGKAKMDGKEICRQFGQTGSSGKKFLYGPLSIGCVSKKTDTQNFNSKKTF